MSAFAGDGHASNSPLYDSCPAKRARFFQPASIAVDEHGVAYVADTENSCIRAINADSGRTVVTVAGAIGLSGFADGQGKLARFSKPTGIAYDAPRRRLLVADTGNDRIRAIDLSTAAVTTLAGTDSGQPSDGPAAVARFNSPTAVTAAADGRVFFVASGASEGPYGSQVKMIGTDASRTVVSLTTGGFGFADGPGTSARLMPQGGLAWDGQALYVADPGNYRIRRITPGADAASTRVVTVAGTGSPGTADGPGDVASFVLPLGIVRATDGTLFVADGIGSIRAVTP
jgi:DNA-binding beta-propeller fold protein YncE